MPVARPQRRVKRGWDNVHKSLVHAYARAANMTDQEYRTILTRYTFPGRKHGAITARDVRLDMTDFDRVIVKLEEELWRRVDAGDVDPPRKYKRGYWATKCGPLGAMTNRQRHHLEELYEALRRLHPTYDIRYLNTIVSKATKGAVTEAYKMDCGQAWAVIEAIQCRLDQEQPADA